VGALWGARSGGLFLPRPAAPAIPQYGAVSVVEPSRQHTAIIIWLDAPPGSASSPERETSVTTALLRSAPIMMRLYGCACVCVYVCVYACVYACVCDIGGVSM
jgi:hypothetical protein